MTLHVLIAVDESESSVRAASVAHRLFGDDAHYTMLSVVDQPAVVYGTDQLRAGTPYSLAVPGAGSVGGIPFSISHPNTDHAVAIDPVQVATQRAGEVAAEAELTDAERAGELGDPADSILTFARDRDADVIVVGDHDRSWLSRLLTPSVAKAVAARADIPVLIAR